MTKIALKKPAFSLAEALITLLIVCLITIASVPILTKKKRDMTKHTAGKWMCTINSRGEHVFWDSKISDTDPLNPDTWEKAQDGTGCTFIPPVNAKNYAFTVIGGGGGGADGVSMRDVFMDTSASETKTIPETDLYRVAVIGSGGGGMGSDDEDGGDNMGFGGQGGAGGYWMGVLKFEKGWSITGDVARGESLRPGSDGGKKCKFEYGRDASWTTLSVPGKNLVAAGTGSSGKSTRNRGGHDPDCGDGGNGGSYSLSRDIKGYSAETRVAGWGWGGRTNGNINHWNEWNIDRANGIAAQTGRCSNGAVADCYRGYTADHQGTTIPGSFWGDDSKKGPYGSGGWGAVFNASRGKYGNPGAVIIWRIIQKPGLGGEAADLNTITIPTVKGKVKMVIGQGGLQNQKGQTTTVDIYDIQGKIARTIKGTGGKAGESGDRVDEKTPSSKVYKGNVGNHSLWNNTGGGTAGECYPAGVNSTTETYYETEAVTDTEGNPICEIAMVDVGAVKNTTGANKYTCPYNETTNPKGVCLGCYYPDCEFEYDPSVVPNGDPFAGFTPLTTAATSYKTYVEDLYGMNPLESRLTTFNNFLNEIKTRDGGKMWLKDGWTSDSSTSIGYKLAEGITPSINNTEYVCLKYKTQNVQKERTVEKYSKQAYCTPAGQGTYFGAGGGGGGTSNTLSLFGEGGKGAPGAVIIEW